jgi:hypothetical protein
MRRVIFSQDRRRQGLTHIIERDGLGIHFLNRMLTDIDARRRLCPNAH